jgi:hypothetical protein
MRRIVSIFGILGLVILSSTAWGQPRSFSKKTHVYIEELGKFIESGKNNRFEKIHEKFAGIWEGDTFDAAQKRTIIKISDAMLLKRFQIRDFSLFEQTLINGVDSTIDPDKLASWINAALPVARSSRRSFEQLLITTNGLFKENTLIQQDARRWYASNNNWEFVFDRNKIQIVCTDIDLICKAAADSILIQNTSGNFYLDENIWAGKGGTLTWARVGLDPDKVFAKFTVPYHVNLTKGEITVDSVLFHYPEYLDAPILGKLNDRASSANATESLDLTDGYFPEFSSYEKGILLGTFFEGRGKFYGGFTIRGQNIVGSGSVNEPAEFKLFYKDQLKILAQADNFTLKDSRLVADKVATTIYTDSGQIYHPRLNFNLNLEQKSLLLKRGTEGLEQAPFVDTDHQLEFKVDEVKWDIEEPKIEMKMKVPDATARFESASFFKEFRYEKIQGILAYNPLNKMERFCIQYRTRDFTLEDYALAIGSKKIHLKQQIIQLADEGFLYYNPQNDSIHVRTKLLQHVNNHRGFSDYDVVRFYSVIGARPNAYLSLLNGDLVIEGVRAFKFSDSQNVAAFPHEQLVRVKHNRELQFGGRITAGRFDLYAQNFDFKYETFSVSSTSIDSLKLFYPDSTGGEFLLPVKTVLRDLNGVLKIDRFNNRSGRKDYPEYPIFESKSSSLITYEKPEIYNRAYKEETFRFEVDPFIIDSLDNFTIEGLQFPGTFKSAGILPDFEYSATIMRDYSLGFTKEAPPGGYPLYGGRGQGDIRIELSERGLWAMGSVEYSGAEMTSSKILLLPEEMRAEADRYSIKESDKYPRVEALDVVNNWRPYDDAMKINTNGHEVDILRDGQKFLGDLTQTSKQLSGNGVLDWDEATVTSKDMDFGTNKVRSDTAKIEIKSIDQTRIALSSNYVDVDVNFDTRKGEFRSKVAGSFTDLPINQYSTTLNEFTWDMDLKTITFDKGSEIREEEAFFVSRHPDQGGLSFQSKHAVYDMKTSILEIEEIPYIDIADSRLFPFEGKATVLPEAVLKPFKQAKFLASRDNEYHQLYDANITVYGKYSIAGNAKYVFKDKYSTGQELYFDKMVVMKKDTTVKAIGFVSDSMGFDIYPKFQYYGGIELGSQHEFIAVNGYVKPLHSFDYPESTWLRYQNRPDPNYMVFDVKNPKTKEQRPVYITVSLANDSNHLYPTFVSGKRSYGDQDLLKAYGVLFYDESEKQFMAGDSDRLFNGAQRGNYLILDETSKTFEGGGKLDIGMDLGENFNALTAGTITKQQDDSSFMINLMMALNITLPEACYERMAEVMKLEGAGAPSASITPEMKSAAAEFVDDKRLKKMFADEALGEVKPQGDLERDLVITQALLTYSSSRRSYVSWDPIYIATVKGQQVNKEFDARIQMTQRRSGTRLTMYIEVTKYDWFYIDYYLGSLTVTSTDKQFNDALLDGARKLSKGKFRIRPATPRTVTRWLDKLGEPE